MKGLAANKPASKMRKLSNILITGGAGFIGSNLVRYIFEKTDFGGKIINFDSAHLCWISIQF